MSYTPTIRTVLTQVSEERIREGITADVPLRRVVDETQYG